MLHQKQVKSVLNKHKKSDSCFLDEYSVNPYKGCSCNYQYCYIPGSKYSENMNEGLAVKTNTIKILDNQLALQAKKNQYDIIAVASGTEKIIIDAKEYRAYYILTGGLTMFGNGVTDSKTLFYKFLERYNPSLLPPYQQLYGANFYTPLPYQNKLKEKAEKLCNKHKIRNSILA
jgi:hypothetical protein